MKNDGRSTSSRFVVWAGLRSFLFFFLLWWVQSAVAFDWPQEVTAPEGVIIIYQPQPESLSGNILVARAAMSLELEESEEPIFGVVWFSSKLETDRDSDSAIISHIKVERVAWPESTDASEQRFTRVVEEQLAVTAFTTELSKITASLSASEKVQQSLDDLKNDPPEILFTRTLAILLSYDGTPIFSEIESSPYERALNTPLVVIRDTKTNRHFLTSGSLWYQSDSAMGPWESTSLPPADLKRMIPKSSEPIPSRIPEIVSVMVPTELIVTEGQPDWQSLAGDHLLYVKNTETPWLRDLPTGNMYILLSGRWYRSKKEEGPWTFVRADELPASFKDIPPESDIGGLRTSVAGTEEANQAVIDAQIPQTAAINRDDATLDVTYDGAPKFEKIPGADVSYAVNTAMQVLLVDNQYFAVDDGVWFSSSSATGPWIVADAVPTEKIAKIPPSSPVYNVRYVTIYESTPQVVYVGYTPGYLWSYPYYGVPVYGTGWYYPPYYGAFYYPRPPTWGLHVGYNPWTGWSFGVSWGGPFLRVGVGWGGGYHHPHYGGWYGGGGYRHNNININTGDINIGNNVNIGTRDTARKKLASSPGRDNLYRRPENRQRNAGNAALSRDLKQARSSRERPNNLYAGKNGQVARRDGSQWQTRSNNKWQNVPSQLPTNKLPTNKLPTNKLPTNKLPNIQKPATRPQQLPQTRPQASQFNRQQRPQAGRQQFNRQNMNRQYRARQMGGSAGARRR